MRSASLALALLLMASAASAQKKPLDAYHDAQILALSHCSTALQIARIDMDTAMMTRTAAPAPSTVAFDCISKAEADVKARYTALAADMPERDRNALVDIQVAWVTAIRATGGREFSALRAKFDEAWNRWEATH